MNGTKENVLGVALTKCFYCLGSGNILMNTRLNEHAAKRVEAMHNYVVDMEPCSECHTKMSEYIALIEIDNSKSDEGWTRPAEGQLPNPYRTGALAWMKDHAFEHIFIDPVIKKATEFGKKNRFMFVEAPLIANLEKMQKEGKDEGKVNGKKAHKRGAKK